MKPVSAVLIAVVLLTVPAANAQDKSALPEAAASPQGAGEAEHSGLGDVMVLQQMRHLKLWFAGRAGNWPLSDYEIDGLKDGFDDVSRLLGGDIVQKAVGAPLAALQKAAADKDRAGFTTAFDNLTSGCNGCHHLLDHGFIVIKRPTLL